MNDIPAYPAQIDIDLTTRCNLSCRFCHLNVFYPETIRDLTYEDFMLLDPLLPELKSITLFSKYEPLMCKDFIKIFNKVSEYGIESYFTTNGVLLSEKIIDNIIGKLKYLTVSITGFTGESYRKNMGKDLLDTVEANIALINKRKKEINTELPILRIATVGLLDVIHELKIAIDFAKKYDAKEGVLLTSFIAYDQELLKYLPLSNLEYYNKIICESVDYAKKLDVKLDVRDYDLEKNNKETEKLDHKYCNMPWHRLSIQADGNVYPCPVAYRSIGNMFVTPVLDIWNGENLKIFREGINNYEKLNYDCKNCVHCRHKSVLKNDFSQIKTYMAGLKRK